MKQKTVRTRTTHQFTKDEIKSILTMWEEKSREEIGDELGLTVQQIMYVAGQIRKAGYPLTKKHKKGYLRNLVVESLRELKLQK